jgi:hypothetical protein
LNEKKKEMIKYPAAEINNKAYIDDEAAARKQKQTGIRFLLYLLFFVILVNIFV